MARHRRVRVRSHTRLVKVKGASRARDKRRHAKKPGKRRSRSGRTYYEYRQNRADVGRWL